MKWVMAWMVLATLGHAIKFEKAWLKVSYVQEGERMQRARIWTDIDKVDEIGTDSVTMSGSDTISIQASFVDDGDKAVGIRQAFLRFLNKDTNEDNIYLLRKKGLDMKFDLSVSKEIRADRSFWAFKTGYRVELIMGDVKLDKSRTWVIIEDLKFSEDSESFFEGTKGKVFDFDIGIKKILLPEFSATIKAEEARARAASVGVAVLAILVGSVVLLWTLGRMGALRFEMTGNAGTMIGFGICVLGHVGALGMFWWQWNIVETWKVMGMIMVPTILFGRSVLLEDEK